MCVHLPENGNGESASKEDKDTALASAKAFKSNNSFFIIVMKPYHVNGGGTSMVNIMHIDIQI